MPPRTRTLSHAIQPGVGRPLPLADQPQNGLEGGHGRLASVEPERELIQVGLHVLAADAAVVGTQEPRLEV